MQEHLGFLRNSSAVLKVAAWIFLCLGGLVGILILIGYIPSEVPLVGVIILAMYGFVFFFFNLVARMADILIKIIEKEQS